MTGAGDPSIEALLAAARAQFAAGLPSRIEALDGFVARERWEEARRAAHKLRGAAATYGYAALGESAGAIEQTLLDADDRPGDADRARLAEMVSASRAEAVRAAGAP